MQLLKLVVVAERGGRAGVYGLAMSWMQDVLA